MIDEHNDHLPRPRGGADMRKPRMFEPRSILDFVVLGVILGSGIWWTHHLRTDIPVISIVGG
jgi:hypothetical protein